VGLNGKINFFGGLLSSPGPETRSNTFDSNGMLIAINSKPQTFSVREEHLYFLLPY